MVSLCVSTESVYDKTIQKTDPVLQVVSPSILHLSTLCNINKADDAFLGGVSQFIKSTSCAATLHLTLFLYLKNYSLYKYPVNTTVVTCSHCHRVPTWCMNRTENRLESEVLYL